MMVLGLGPIILLPTTVGWRLLSLPCREVREASEMLLRR